MDRLHLATGVGARRQPDTVAWTVLSEKVTGLYSMRAPSTSNRGPRPAISRQSRERAPSLWVVLRQPMSTAHEIFAVTAVRRRAGAFTEAGNDLVRPLRCRIDPAIRAHSSPSTTWNDNSSSASATAPIRRRWRDAVRCVVATNERRQFSRTLVAAEAGSCAAAQAETAPADERAGDADEDVAPVCPGPIHRRPVPSGEPAAIGRSTRCRTSAASSSRPACRGH